MIKVFKFCLLLNLASSLSLFFFFLIFLSSNFIFYYISGTIKQRLRTFSAIKCHDFKLSYDPIFFFLLLKDQANEQLYNFFQNNINFNTTYHQLYKLLKEKKLEWIPLQGHKGIRIDFSKVAIGTIHSKKRDRRNNSILSFLCIFCPWLYCTKLKMSNLDIPSTKFEWPTMHLFSMKHIMHSSSLRILGSKIPPTWHFESSHTWEIIRTRFKLL